MPRIDTDAVTAALPLHLPPRRAGDDPAASGRSSPRPRTGEPIDDRYRIAEQIGHGGSAAVYRGLDTRLQRPVAVKIFHPSATDPWVIPRRQAEVDFLVRCEWMLLYNVKPRWLISSSGSCAVVCARSALRAV